MLLFGGSCERSPSSVQVQAHHRNFDGLGIDIDAEKVIL